MESYLATVKSRGGRITKIRKAIIALLIRKSCLLSAPDIRVSLHSTGLTPDRTTVFRELGYLADLGIVVKSAILGTSYYEIPRDHHHHLVCLKCHRISDVSLGNHLTLEEARIAKANRFTVVGHSLEFFGYCRRCRHD